MKPSLSIVFLLSLAAVACGGGDPLSASMWLGSADVNGTGFVEVDDGAAVELVPGGQGGFHVWINVRLQGVEAGTYRITREARRVSDNILVLRSSPDVIEVTDTPSDQWWERDAAAAAFMCPTPIGVNIESESLRFVVRLTRPGGSLVASDEIVLIPTCPATQVDICMSICTG